MDDEYARAGEFDPRVMVTTSRDPSSRLVQFAKEMSLIFPNAQRINRGAYTTKEVVEACRSNEVTDLVLVHEHRGEPDGLVISHMPHGPTAFFGLTSVVTRHDIKAKESVSEAYPHLIFEAFESKLGTRVTNVLKHLFPVPKDESKRVVTFSNRNDFISFRHHVRRHPPFPCCRSRYRSSCCGPNYVRTCDCIAFFIPARFPSPSFPQVLDHSPPPRYCSPYRAPYCSLAHGARSAPSLFSPPFPHVLDHCHERRAFLIPGVQQGLAQGGGAQGDRAALRDAPLPGQKDHVHPTEAHGVSNLLEHERGRGSSV